MADVIDVIIVGGGASGLFAGILLAEKGWSVTILERNTVVGKKLLTTGNGRCNYTNLYQDESCFRSKETKKAMNVLSAFNVEQILDRFKTMGILPDVKKGRCSYNIDSGYVYPKSDSAKDFVATLFEENLSLGVKIRTNTQVKNIEKKSDIFLVTVGESNYSYQARYVIITVGGLAAPSTGSDGNLNPIIQKLGHSFVKQRPALTFLTSSNKELKELKGVRLAAEISVLIKGKKVGSEYGELQFSERGISGIPAMQLSGLIAAYLDSEKEVSCEIDFYTGLTQTELRQYLVSRRDSLKNRKAELFFLGMLNEKLSSLIFKKYLTGFKLVSEIGENTIDMISRILKSYPLSINGFGDFQFAQTTSGGVSLTEVGEGLESEKVSKLYFAGEVLDVDGLCGGYNLTWAWASAYTVSENIGEKYE